MSIKTRAYRFQFTQPNDRKWFDNSSIKSFDLNILGLFIPFLEVRFIRVIRDAQKRFKVTVNHNDVSAFMHQEANHWRAHNAFYETYIQPFYPNLPKLLLIFKVFMLPALLGLRLRVAMVAAAEHFTTVLSAHYLKNTHHYNGMPKEAQALWFWHCIEEMEHRHVAFDLLPHFKIDYWTRVITYLFCMGTWAICYCLALLYFITTDRLWTWSFIKEMWSFYFGNPGHICATWRDFLVYLKPSFHPKQITDHPPIEPLEHLFKDIATASDFLSRRRVIEQ